VLHTAPTPYVADHPDDRHAITAYLGERGALPMPRQGAIAIASAITGDRLAMTNHPWSFSISELRSQLGFHRLEVINDSPRWRWPCRTWRRSTGCRLAAGRLRPGQRWACSPGIRGSAYPA